MLSDNNAVGDNVSVYWVEPCLSIHQSIENLVYIIPKFGAQKMTSSCSINHWFSSLESSGNNMPYSGFVYHWTTNWYSWTADVCWFIVESKHGYIWFIVGSKLGNILSFSYIQRTNIKAAVTLYIYIHKVKMWQWLAFQMKNKTKTVLSLEIPYVLPAYSSSVSFILCGAVVDTTGHSCSPWDTQSHALERATANIEVWVIWFMLLEMKAQFNLVHIAYITLILLFAFSGLIALYSIKELYFTVISYSMIIERALQMYFILHCMTI